MGLFAAGALGAGAAPSLAVLVAARAVQGAGAAAAVPAALALIAGLFPEGPRRTRALSLLAAMASVGVMSGLLLGGVITQLLGWRWVFLLMAPAAALAGVAAPRVLPAARSGSTAGPPDVAGAALVTAASVSVLFGVTRVEHDGAVTALVLGPAVLAAALLAAFVARERRAPAPLVRLDVLAGRSLRIATLGVALNAIVFTAVVYGGTMYLQTALSYDPFEAAAALLPVDAVGFLVAVGAAGRVARRSPRTVLMAAFGSSALAMLWLARTPEHPGYVADVMAPLVVLGASLSLAFVVLTKEAVAEVAPGERGLASGVFETANHLLGGAVGVALYATVIATADHPGDRDGFGRAFLVAAGLAALGVVLARRARR
jgi:MFS family permease